MPRHDSAIGDPATAFQCGVGVVGQGRRLDRCDAPVACDPPHAVMITPSAVNHLLFGKLSEGASAGEPGTLHICHAGEGLAGGATALARSWGHCPFTDPIDLTRVVELSG